MGALEDVTRKKFQAFMEVRNQFMHNLEAVSYTKCFKYIPDTGKFILKTYPQDVKKSEEEQLSLAVEKLTSEVLNLTGDLIEKLKEKFYDDAKSNVYKESHKALVKSIFDTKAEISQLIDEVCSKHQSIDPKELRTLNDMFVAMTYKNLEKRFKENRQPSKKNLIEVKVPD